MRRFGLLDRLLPMVATLTLLGVAGWSLAAARLVVVVAAAEGLLLAAAMASSVLSLRRQWGGRLGEPLWQLLRTAVNVTIATSVLLVAGSHLPGAPVLAVVGFTAVLLTLDPASPGWVLGSETMLAAGALALVWTRLQLDAGLGAAGVLVVPALLVALAVLARTNWALLDRRDRLQSRRLEGMAVAARTIAAATDPAAIAAAALEAGRQAYPETTYGALLVSCPPGNELRGVGVYLGPDGMVPVDDFSIGAGVGVSGRVFTDNRSMLLGTGQAIEDAYAGAAPEQLLEARRRGGPGMAKSMLAVPLRSPNGEAVGVLVFNSHVREHVWEPADVAVLEAIANDTAVALERARLFERERVQSLTDPLTGLPNRRGYDEHLATHAQRPLAILAVDVDNLKAVNDEYGHEWGDALLRQVARTLQEHLREGDLLARTGGDEFAAVLVGADLALGQQVGERMRDSLHGIAAPHGTVRASFGVASANGGSEAEVAWRAADAALAEAKQRGRDRVVVATPEETVERTRHSDEVAGLVDAVVAGRLNVAAQYQPIVALTGGGVMGYEALARFPAFRDAGAGVEDVFAIGQRLGVTRDLDWVCRRAALEGARDASGVPLFLNVSVTSLLDPLHPVDQMLLLSRWAGRDPSTIILEISEREPVNDRRRLGFVLASYREHGFRFALDDVGEGHSTVEVLSTATPEYVKLAGSVAAHLAERGACGVIEATVAFARSTGGQVIAEGVEDASTADALRRLGVELAQGWFLGRPLWLSASDAGSAVTGAAPTAP